MKQRLRLPKNVVILLSQKREREKIISQTEKGQTKFIMRFAKHLTFNFRQLKYGWIIMITDSRCSFVLITLLTYVVAYLYIKGDGYHLKLVTLTPTMPVLLFSGFSHKGKQDSECSLSIHFLDNSVIVWKGEV